MDIIEIILLILFILTCPWWLAALCLLLGAD